MSSRALRKLQKERELQEQLAAAAKGTQEDDDAAEDEEEYSLPLPQKNTANAFDMLDAAGEDHDNSDVDDDQDHIHSTITQKTQPSDPINSASKAKRKKKKKTKKRGKEKAEDTVDSGVPEEEMDEVDRALKELAMKEGRSISHSRSISSTEGLDSLEVEATKLLSIDSKHLNPVNEMKSLFGNIALEGSSTSRPNTRTQRRREVNQQGGVDLATALTGQYSPASKGKGLGALASRKNIFMRGKEEWPLATSGGLSMEYIPDNTKFEKHYDIAHNQAYQEVQFQFRLCVESMEPQNLIKLLTLNPYHIATLLQVSEIAKHQGDHSVSADLLERALYSFGRSVHSTFAAALREGTVRLDFKNLNNRELYMTIWKYIRNLEMRGTWRTAFEWAKLLFQFNTRSDPYGMTMMIDQLAIRGRQFTTLIELCSDHAYGSYWRHLPNMQISLALAYQRSSQPKLARQQLAIAIDKFPYVISAMASALDISPLPKSIWGKLPTTDAEKLYTELYVTRAKDLWNTPESTSLIVEVAETLDHYSDVIKSSSSVPPLEISIEEARHIMLLEIPPLIALLPRNFTNRVSSSLDVLPPPDAQEDLTLRAPGQGASVSPAQALVNAARAPSALASGVLSRILEYFSGSGRPNDQRGDEDAPEDVEGMEELGDALGVQMTPELMEELLGLDSPEGRAQAAALGFTQQDMGEFDYYIDRANAASSDDQRDGEDEDDLPDLESLPGQHLAEDQNRNPHAATVEEDEEEDDSDADPHSRPTTDGAILRHVDSDDETSDTWLGSGRLQSLNPTVNQSPNIGSSQNPPEQSAPSSAFDSTDPQRIQRWLLSAGLETLQGADPTGKSLADYVAKLQMLRKPQQEWIVNIVKQRTGKEIADRITGRLA